MQDLPSPRLYDGKTFFSLRCDAWFGADMHVCSASGFLVKYDEKCFFVTNFHVLSGRHAETLDNLSKQGTRPDRLTINFPDRSNLFRSVRYDIALNGEHAHPRWYCHPIFQNQVDVAVVEVLPPEQAAFWTQQDYPDHRYTEVAPGQGVFVIGFPRGLGLGETGGMWKRGTIATDPKLDLGGLPKILIDTATREGMSGSPVFVEDNVVVGDIEIGPGVDPNKPWRTAPVYSLLGIYSGRLGQDEFLAQLGIVWKRRTIFEVIKGANTFDGRRAVAARGL